MRMKIKNKTYVLLMAVTFLAVWGLAGRYGLFASQGDWSSQHSVIPDCFRQQFYETGKLFPEFAAGLGGGQNIYRFSYYGLYSPLILPSYLMPFVKMSDYLMAVSVLCLLTAVLLMHYWLKTHGYSSETAFLASVLFLLASPMIYQAHRQVMFVDYMPFLCMSLIGVDRYFKNGKTGLYTAGVFGMVMTSFYFSIAGICAVLLYGVCMRRKEGIKGLLRLFIPVMTAVAAAGILLVPTAYTLFERGKSQKEMSFVSLLLPDFSVTRFAYSGYGIGLTAGILIVLFSFLFIKDKRMRFLSAGCLAVVTIPFFSWLFNGGLYARGKSLIPFLPVLCCLAAEFLERVRKKEISFQICMAGYLITVFWCVISAVFFQEKEFEGEYAVVFSELLLWLLSAVLYRKTKLLPLLFLPAILYLTAAGLTLNGVKSERMEKEFYESVTDASWEKEISGLLAREEGLFRLEQKGNYEEKLADINRIWDARQWTTSMYSSACPDAYKNFREHVFQTEQPFRNSLMQPASENPLFQKFMGVKYLVKKDSKSHADKPEELTADIQECAAPVIYATDRVISEDAYRKLEFPYNQTALMQYAVANAEDAPAKKKEASFANICESGVSIPESLTVHKTDKGYRIRSKQKVQTVLSVSEREKDASMEQLLYIQFEVRNYKKTKDVTVELERIRNKLSAENHIYYNGNTIFTYVFRLEKGQKEADVLFGKGDYAISNIRCFLGETSILKEKDLYQSAFCPNRTLTKGNIICGEIDAKQDGYLITSIPYDRGFEIRIDGRKRECEIVNTAFLGAKILKGAHKIEIRYHAPGVFAGKLLTCMGLLLWSGAAVLERKKYALSMSFGYNFLTFLMYNRKKVKTCGKRSVYGKHIDYRR